jgi:hypothetical protein
MPTSSALSVKSQARLVLSWAYLNITRTETAPTTRALLIPQSDIPET